MSSPPPPALPERRPESPAIPDAMAPVISPTSVSPPALSATSSADASTHTALESPSHASTAPPPLPERTPDNQEPHDPRVAALKAMFPDFDEQIMISVLESVNGDQDRAIDMLLGMSDPEYKAQQAVPPPAARAMTQTDLDEEFARRLMLEDQEESDRAAAMYYEQQQQQHNAQRWQPQTSPGGQPTTGRDGISEFQDQVKQFGETGLKTINSLFSKVKAKIQEFDQGNNASGSTSQAPQMAQQQQQSQAPWAASPNAQYQPYVGRRSQEHAARRSHEAAAAEYDSPIRLGDAPVSPGVQAGHSSPGYDLSPSPSPAPRPTSRSSAPIDGGRFGVLPKRPVSLVRDTPSSSQRPPDDDDELEYAENPFDTEDKGVKPAK
ncbi:hypothetical protein BD626DRAFT_563825 [Schizophyllum amplum]|uniref:CUE domain-containing protein n=1 Tax=Schizophyllum amplum TaxID=97359 RepID=A0A550CZE7_9AGAR|nr:hypothetical protein BD626DRAFT_563825 [Auriculariopsis ampla]